MPNCSSHSNCISDAVQHAESVCLKAGARLTKTRKQILEMLWQSHQPRKAYDLLSELTRLDPTAKPPTVYRALDFLLELGLVHKVESLNAFIGCAGRHAHQYLVCQKCHDVKDIGDDGLTNLVQAKAAQKGFQVTTAVIEIKGLCANCHSV